MGAVFRRWRTSLERHRQAATRIGVVLLIGALGLLVTGGMIRVLRAADRDPPPAASSGSPEPEWTASTGAAITGLAVDDGRLYVSGEQLLVFPTSCIEVSGRCTPRWRGVVADGPLSVPTIRDDRVFVGSSSGQVYAFPATCEGEGCAPDWVGVAGDGLVSQPAANFDLVYVTSDELYAFPAACASDDAPCLPAWTADVPGRPAAGPPALGAGLVVVASSSTRGGVAAYPAVCGEDCEPLWTGRTDGPATSVAIGDDLAYTVARGQLMAFDLTCTSRCEPAWRGPFVPGAPFATGATSAPAVAGDRVLVGDERGRLWVFRSACGQARCDPVARIDVASTALLTPVVDGDRAIVTSVCGAIGRVLLDCRPDDDCEALRVRSLGGDALAPAVVSPEATVAGNDAGALEAFKW
jgi:outer membrane protein assembly factor BamB